MVADLESGLVLEQSLMFELRLEWELLGEVSLKLLIVVSVQHSTCTQAIRPGC